MAEIRPVAVTLKLTGSEAAELDSARGSSRRETWARTAVLTAARAETARKAAPVPEACPPHPKRRVIKGLCGACGRAVGDEKTA